MRGIRKVLDKPFAVPAVHANGHWLRIRLPALRRDQSHGWIAEHFGTPRYSQSARCGDTDANPGKTARTKRNEDTIRSAFIRQRFDHGDQPFGMAAAQHNVLTRNQVAESRKAGAPDVLLMSAPR